MIFMYCTGTRVGTCFRPIVVSFQNMQAPKPCFFGTFFRNKNFFFQILLVLNLNPEILRNLTAQSVLKNTKISVELYCLKNTK